MPWHFHLKQGETLEQRLLACWQTGAEADKHGTLSPADQQALVRLLASAGVRQRLHWQFSEPLRQQLLKQVAPDHLETLLQILQTLSAAHIPTAVFYTFSSTLWKTAFQRLSQHQQPDVITLLVDTIYQLQIVDFDQEPHHQLFEVITQHWPLVFHTEQNTQAVRYTAQEAATAYTETAVPESSLFSNAEVSHTEQNTQAVRHTTQEPVTAYTKTALSESGLFSDAEISHTKQNTQAAMHTAQEAATAYTETVVPETATSYQKYAIQKTDSLYTGQAGLVLLHPFLPRFFTTLGIGDDARLLQAERAPGLLYFLATGQILAPEYELLLPKVLCNLPLDAPLPADIGITQNEQNEATALLQAVIHHWAALRNTTPDGLRGNFLSRLGKLSPYPDGGWLLQVETQTHDILLDQLPWGIGMIKLPWMPYLLRVEWSA
ncbi:MAG: hypothetical protein HC877_09430 [Thioploca sp.]|nr:hypothetical protein [Thioploca sp.]